MNFEIILTPRANETLLSLILFIQTKWGEKSVEKFVERAYKTLDTIASQPYIFKAYRETNVRKGFISKQTSVVYGINHNRIEVLFFWDNRQEPII